MNKLNNINEIITYGEFVNSWPCDINEFNELESNGSIEEVWYYKGKKYHLFKTWEGEYFKNLTNNK